MAATSRQRRSQAKVGLRLADTLYQRATWSKAMTTGRVNRDQARVIAHALDVLPRTGSTR